MNDYLKELPHEADCSTNTGLLIELGLPALVGVECTCRRAEALAYVDGLRSYVVVMADQYTSEEREAAGNDQGDVSDGFDLAILDARNALDKS